jgi:hypothetical protein
MTLISHDSFVTHRKDGHRWTAATGRPPGRFGSWQPVGCVPLTSGDMESREQDRQILAKYLSLVKEARMASVLSTARRSAVRDLNKMAPTVRRILRRTGPDLAGHPGGKFLADHLGAHHVVARALRLAELQVAWEINQDPEKPALQSAVLHPAIWGAAQASWEAGLYRQAVQAAATAVNDLAQARLERRDLSDVKLMQEAFSAEAPKPGVRRLRCPGDQTDVSVKDQQRGALHYAVGCFTAMRNPATHQLGQWNPLTAFEYITALSVLARWIDFWDLDMAPPPPITLPPPPR